MGGKGVQRGTGSGVKGAGQEDAGKGGPVLDPVSKPQGPSPLKIRVESLAPNHVVDAWRLIEDYQLKGIYPDYSEESKDAMVSFLFSAIQSRNACGLIAKSGKRSVGIILGFVSVRPCGRPSKYVKIAFICVEPAYQKRGVGGKLWKEYAERMKKAGINHFECEADEKAERMIAEKKWAEKKLALFSGRF